MKFYKQIERIFSYFSDWRVFTLVTLLIWILVTIITHPNITIAQLIVPSLGVGSLALLAYALEKHQD